MELGRWTAISYGVIDNRSENLQHCQWALAQWAALKDQQKRGGVELNGAYFPRVRARAEPSDALRRQTDPLEPAGRRFANLFFESSFSTVLFRDFPSDVGQQTDPQSDRPAGAACWPPSPLL